MGSSSPIGRIKGAQEEDRPCGHCAVDAAMLGVGQDRFHQPKTSRRYHSFTIGVEWRAVLDATHAVGNYCNFFNLLQPWNLDTRNRSRTPLSLCRATVKAFWSRVVESYEGSTETVTVVAAAAPAWAEVVAAAAPAAYVTLPAPRPVQSSLGHRAMRYIDPAAAASSPVDRWTPSARQDPSKSNSAALAVLHST